MTAKKLPVIRLFCRKLEPCFSRFPGGKREPFIRAVCEELKDFDDRVLSEAAQRILRTAKGMTWPNVGELYRTCVEVRAELKRKAEAETSLAPSAKGERQPLPERVAVDIMVRADAALCLNAIAAGYHPLILDYVKAHRDMPDDAECERLYEESNRRLKRAQSAYDANPCHINGYYLRGLLGRRETIARLIVGAVAELSDRSMDHVACEDAES